MGLRAEQHAVAEDVTRHVADADHGEGLGLDIAIEFAEVALDRFPGAAGGDAHLLVVVTHRTAGGKGVAEPEVAIEGDGVGGVGKARGALVGGNDQIGVLGVASDDIRRGDDLVGHEIVGDVEQGGDEDLVAGGAFALDGLAVGFLRHQLGDEGALGADRHDDGVLDLLGFDEAQHFGAEILRPVGPAQAAAGDGAEAEMQAFDAGRIDKDFAEGFGFGQFVDFGAVELQRQSEAAVAGAVALVGIGADHGLDEVEVAPDDAVFVERRGGVEGDLDGFPRVGSDGAVALEERVVLGVEQGHQSGGDVRVGVEHGDEIAAREGDADLLEIFRQGAEQFDVDPVQAGLGGELVEAVAFGGAAPDREDALFDEAGVGQLGAGRRFQHHVVHPGVADAIGGDGVGRLVDDAEAEVFQHRHAGRERDGGAAMVDLEAIAAVIAVAGAELDGDGAVVGEAIDDADIGERLLGRVAGLVAGREGVAIGLDEAAVVGERGELVAEAEGQFGDGVFEFVAVGSRRRAAIAADDEMDADEVAFGEARIVGRDAAVIDGLQVLADAGADVAVVAVAGDEDQDRDEVVEAVDAGEDPDARPVDEGGDGGGEFEELVFVDLEQFVARVGIERVHQRLAGMACRIEGGAAHDLGNLAPDQRHFGVRRRHGHGGEKADDAEFAGDFAEVAVEFHAHIIHVAAAVDAGAHIGLGDHQGLGPLEELDMLRGHLDIVGTGAEEAGLGVFEDTDAAIGHGLEAGALEAIFAHAQEGEIVLGEPAEEMHALGHLLGRRLGGMVVPLLDDVADAFEHRAPAGDDAADIGQDRVGLGDQRLAGGIGGERIDLEVQEALEPAARLRHFEDAVGLRIELQDRVGQEADGAADRPHRCQHAVDDEGHVSREYLDDFRVAGPLGGHEIDAVVGQLALAQPRIGFAEQRFEHVGRMRLQVLRVGGFDRSAQETGKARLGVEQHLSAGKQIRARLDVWRLVHLYRPPPQAVDRESASHRFTCRVA